MRSTFRNRAEAGKILAGRLQKFAGRPDVIVLALPRGGVPVAYEVAKALGVPLDVFVVRKLGVPGHEELAMGAIASGGVRVLNRDVIESLGIGRVTIEHVAAREQRELERREQAYRDDLPPPEVCGRTVLLIDDGVATGSTMRAAVEALRHRNAGRIVVAVPTAAPATARALALEADEFFAVMTPADFSGVGQWYDDFAQTTDEEVRDLMALSGMD